MERCGDVVGPAVVCATAVDCCAPGAVNFGPPAKYQAPPARTTRAAIPAIAGNLRVAPCGFCLGGRPELQRINPDRLRDVLELRLAEIDDREIEAPLDLTVGVLGKADRSWLGDPLESGRDVDAVAHQIAVSFLDYVADMDADAEDDATVFGHACVALDHRVLHFDRAAHRIDGAPELDDCAVACALDDAAFVHGDCRVDEVAAKRAQPRKYAVLVGSRKPRIADDVGRQDRG